MVSQEVQEYINSRLLPLETQFQSLLSDIRGLKSNTDEMKDIMASRDADLRRAEVRFEEIAQEVKSWRSQLKIMVWGTLSMKVQLLVERLLGMSLDIPPLGRSKRTLATMGNTRSGAQNFEES